MRPVFMVRSRCLVVSFWLERRKMENKWQKHRRIIKNLIRGVWDIINDGLTDERTTKQNEKFNLNSVWILKQCELAFFLLRLPIHVKTIGTTCITANSLSQQSYSAGIIRVKIKKYKPPTVQPNSISTVTSSVVLATHWLQTHRFHIFLILSEGKHN